MNWAGHGMVLLIPWLDMQPGGTWHTPGIACDGKAVLALAYASYIWSDQICTVPTLTIYLYIFNFILIPRDGGLRM